MRHVLRPGATCPPPSLIGCFGFGLLASIVFRGFDTVHDMTITLSFSDLHHLITSTLFIRDTQPHHCVPFLKWAVQELDPLFP